MEAELSWRLVETQTSEKVTLGEGFEVCRVQDALLLDADDEAGETRPTTGLRIGSFAKSGD